MPRSRPRISVRPWSQRAIAAILAAALPACTAPVDRYGSGSSAVQTPPGEGGGGGGADLPLGPGGLPLVPSTSIVPTDSPIKLPASTSVSSSGAAVVTIPLAVPDGPNHLSPDLAITIAGSGNGRLGIGGALGGTSAIAPCNKTTATDGYPDGVDFTSSDAYCLDGARLIAVSNDGPTRTFHTEHESMARVTAVWPLGAAQPTSFTVEMPGGQTATYQPRHAMRLEGSGETTPPTATHAVVPVYPIEKVVDESGFELRYVYEDEPGATAGDLAYRLARIDYSFASNEQPRRQVVFHYQDRPDKIVSYRSGVRSRITTRLASIEMRAPNPVTAAMVWKYELAYELSPDSKRSRLRSVRMCAADGMCSGKKTLSWTVPASGIVDETISDQVELTANALQQDILAYSEIGSKQPFYGRSDIGLLVFDADGDGRDDVLYRSKDTFITPVYVPQEFNNDDGAVYVNWSLGTFFLRRSTPSGLLDDRQDVSGFLEPVVSTSTDPAITEAHLLKSRVADLDFDGHPDFLAARTRFDFNGKWMDGNVRNWHKWTYGYHRLDGASWAQGATLSPPWDVAKVEDVSIWGPVLRDTSQNDSVASYVRTPPFQRILADLDGDGRVDRVDVMEDEPLFPNVAVENWVVPGGTNPNHPYMATLATGEKLTFGAPWTCGNGNARVTDANGDGRADILVADTAPTGSVLGSFLRMTLADPPPTTPPTPQLDTTGDLWSGECESHLPDLVLLDLNGDGLDDAFYPPGSLALDGVDGTIPMVRWNLGRGDKGFGDLQAMPVADDPAGTLTAGLRQALPLDYYGNPVRWDRGTRAADVNGDGRDDIVAFRLEADNCAAPKMFGACFSLKTKVTVYLSMGDHFRAVPIGTWDGSGVNLATGFTTAQLGDVTGDGAVDLVHVVDGKIRAIELPWRRQADLVEIVSDQLDAPGVAIEQPGAWFDYTRAWWGAPGERPPAQDDCGWPMSCSRRGATVVRYQNDFVGTRADGTQMWRTRVHRFGDPRADLTGRGSRGFAWHRIWDVGLGSETIHQFDNATRVGRFYAPSQQQTTRITPRTPLPTAAQLANGSLTPGLAVGPKVPVRIERTVTTYVHRGCAAQVWNGTWEGCEDSPSSAKILLSRPASIVQQAFENDLAVVSLVSGVPEYTWTPTGLQATSWTEMEYDEFGNATRTTFQIAGNGAADRTETDVAYENRQTPRWRPGLATRTEVRQYPVDFAFPPNQTAPARATEVDYDAEGRAETIRNYGYGGELCVPGTCFTLGTTTTITRTGGVVSGITTQAADVTEPRTLTFQHDAEKIWLSRVTNALGEMATTVYHPALGVPVVSVDPNGVASKRQYDGFGRLRGASQPGTPTVSIGYAWYEAGSRHGLDVTSSATDGSQATARTDELGREIEARTLGFAPGQWSTLTYEYSPFGFVELQTGPPGNHREVERDRLGRDLVVTGDDNAQTTYAHSFFETEVTDPMGHVRYALRDVNGRTIESGHRVANAPYGEVALAYGPFGRLVETRVAGAASTTTSYQYDNFGRLVHVDDPDRGPMTVSYNGFGEPGTMVGAEKTLTIQRDVLGRPVVTIGDDGTTLLAYGTTAGAIGQVVHATSPDGVVTKREFDLLGRLAWVEQRVSDDDPADSLAITYDAFGRLSRIAYPSPGSGAAPIARYEYNPRGFLARIRDVTECSDPGDMTCPGELLWRVIQRTDNHQLARAEYAGGLIHLRRGYDYVTGRLNEIQVPQGDLWRMYEHDDEGLLVSRVEVTGPDEGRHEVFVHDDLHRLTEWTLGSVFVPLPGRTTTYDYDELGNLETIAEDGSPTWSAVYGAMGKPRAAASVNGKELTYDGEGRRLTDGKRTISYTQFDLPRQITIGKKKGSDAVDFLYDAFGQRVRKQSDASTTTYLGKFFERRETPQGDAAVYFVQGPEGVVAQLVRSTVGYQRLFTLGDPLGSVSLVMEIQGGTPTVVERAYFGPFGERVDRHGDHTDDPDPTTTLGFTGHEHDLELGLINMNGRVYDPWTKSFLTADPIISNPLLGQTYHPFSYVHNNPLNLIDPSGFEDEPAEPKPLPPGVEIPPDAAPPTMPVMMAPIHVTGNPPRECLFGADAQGACGAGPGEPPPTERGTDTESKPPKDMPPPPPPPGSETPVKPPTSAPTDTNKPDGWDRWHPRNVVGPRWQAPVVGTLVVLGVAGFVIGVVVTYGMESGVLPDVIGGQALNMVRTPSRKVTSPIDVDLILRNEHYKDFPPESLERKVYDAQREFEQAFRLAPTEDPRNVNPNSIDIHNPDDPWNRWKRMVQAREVLDQLSAELMERTIDRSNKTK